jgi:hypothetical protein
MPILLTTLKCSSISFSSNAPHETMWDHIPYNSIVLPRNLHVPICQELHHGEYQIPQLSSQAYVTFLINMSFFTTSINVIFGIPLHFFRSLNLNQLTLSHWCINLSPLNMIKPSQTTLPHLFINRGHPYL